MLVMIAMVPMVLAMGHLSDRFGRNRIFKAGLLGAIILSIPAFMLVRSGNIYAAFFGLLILGALLSTLQGSLPATLPSLFFTKVRYGALAITYNTATSLFGGTTPLLVAWLVSVTDNKMVPAFYLMGMCAFGIVVVTLFVRETAGRSLRGSAPVVEHPSEINEVLKNPEKAYWWHDETKPTGKGSLDKGLLTSLLQKH